MTKRAAASRSRRRRFFVACALRARKPRKRRAEKEGRPKRKEPRRGARRRGREEVPGAHTQAGRPRGCRARHPPRGHVPNNSVGTRKQLLRNSYYRVTLRAHISRVRLRVAAGGAGGGECCCRGFCAARGDSRHQLCIPRREVPEGGPSRGKEIKIGRSREDESRRE